MSVPITGTIAAAAIGLTFLGTSVYMFVRASEANIRVHETYQQQIALAQFMTAKKQGLDVAMTGCRIVP
jgi:hypothetical protein